MHIVIILLMQAFSYSVPAWVLGLGASQGLSVLTMSGFESLTGIPIDPALTSDAILLATGLGIIIPIAAALFPIRTALGKNLHDSLDFARSKTKAVKISISRSEGNTISGSLIVVGIGLAGFGFGVYYIFPLSLLSFNFALLLNMFFGLLLAMLLGFVLLSLNIQPFLEKVIVTLLLFWEKTAITQIVLKNLAAHRLRNRKTTIMYALSLGFILFISVAFNMTIASVIYGIQQSNGVYLKVVAWPPSRIQVGAALEAYSNSSPLIEGFSWISFSIDDTIGRDESSEVTNIGHVFSDLVELYSVSPNLYSTTIPGFLKVQSTLDDTDFTVAEALYTPRGSKGIAAGSYYRTLFAMDIGDHFLLEITTSDPPLGNSYIRRTRADAFLDSSPSFTFSKFPAVSPQDAVASMTTYLRWANVANPTIESVEDIPMLEFLIKIKEGIRQEDLDDLIGDLNNIISTNPSGGLWVWDYKSDVKVS
jgi:hypothetical protein